MANEEPRRPLGLIRGAVLVGALMLFFSLWLTIWAVRQAPHQPRTGVNLLAPSVRGADFVWAPLEAEKRLYRDAGYQVAWLDGAAFKRGRQVFGPYAAIFEMIALRGYGLSRMIPLLALAVALGLFEGRVAAGEKKAEFGNLSSTRFRLATIISASIIASCVVFVSLPFGVVLPFVGEIPLVWTGIWMSAPHYWGVFFASQTVLAAHQIFSNLTTEI